MRREQLRKSRAEQFTGVEMRIIAGSAKGIRLATPKNRAVRPTLDRVRESLFNILAPRLPDALILDLFAGTGAVGIEALSRGASTAWFIDNDDRSLNLVRQNLQLAKVERQGRVLRRNLPGGLRDWEPAKGAFDIIYADPPHKFEDFENLAGVIQQRGLLKPEGLLVLEHSSRREVALPRPWQVTRSQRFGETTLSFYARESAPEQTEA